MPRKPRPWFRFYTEAVHDPKLRRMPPAHRWVWVAVLAAARKSCDPGVLRVSESQPMDEHDISDLSAVPLREARKALKAMFDAEMLDWTEDGAMVVAKWKERQFESDDVTERTRKHRSQERRRNVPGTAVGTPPDTETDTDSYLHPLVTHDGPVDNSAGKGLIQQAVELAATRYAEDRVAAGKADNPQGLARWWAQENAKGATIRANALVSEYDLTETQLADALLQSNPPWLRHHRRRLNGDQ